MESFNFHRIVARATKYVPSLRTARVVDTWVGWRPMRSEVALRCERIEYSQTDDASGTGQRWVRLTGTGAVRGDSTTERDGWKRKGKVCDFSVTLASHSQLLSGLYSIATVTAGRA